MSNSDEENVPTVRINPVAYVKFNLHALQYPTKDESDPRVTHEIVYGFLLGNRELNVISVNDYIPLYHISSGESDFEDDPLVFNWVAEVNREEIEEYESENTVVGWFHSHGGRGVDFTPTDVKNHLYFQKDFLSGSVAIVFDPSALDEGYGFEIYSFIKDTAIVSEYDIPDTLDWEFSKIEDNEEIFELIRGICDKYDENNPQPIISEWSESE
ncbi:MAG: hypothetical protein ACTSU5_16915 [Promethearchaeota archaeon]